MINTFQLYEEFTQGFGEANARLLVNSLASIYEDLRNHVTKAEFNDLKEIVRDLIYEIARFYYYCLDDE